MPGPEHNPALSIGERDVTWHAVRASGPGGQHVNKTATAVELRFDIAASSLPDNVKARLLATRDRRLTRRGEMIIRAESARSQKQNRADALTRLQRWIRSNAAAPTPRRPTRVPLGQKRARLRDKRRRSETKRLRQRRGHDDG